MLRFATGLRRAAGRVARLRAPGRQIRQYNFGTAEYAKCFLDVPKPDTGALRDAAVGYLSDFDGRRWFEDPIRTVIAGEYFDEGESVSTVDAFGKEVGKQINSPESVVDRAIQHLKGFSTSRTDFRTEVRAIEDKLFGEKAGALIGNQAMDFKKQDGVTEIEEALEANPIEQRLNDQLLADEAKGKVNIRRDPAFVGCVSNFSNFLDLSRKVLRNIELGVPVVILSRTNTAQHMFRWSQMLIGLLEEGGVDTGLVTFVSCDNALKGRMFQAFPDSPLYLTSNRPIAEAIKNQLRNTMSSTGGPNTLVATKFTPQVAAALQMSACIENSGQCTALRHAVLPDVTQDQIQQAFEGTLRVADSKEALEKGAFSALFAGEEPTPLDGYTRSPDAPVDIKVSRDYPKEIDEHWRRAVVDVTTMESDAITGDANVNALSRWLVENQPISLAINGDDAPYAFARALFERTGMVVYTLGSLDTPALTAQARPQDGEVFGEFPPRRELDRYTKFPTIVPSSTPGYNTVYAREYLETRGEQDLPAALKPLAIALDAASPAGRGYAREIYDYLAEVCGTGPREGLGARTALYGLQRPPMDGSWTVIRAEQDTNVDSFLAHVLPFVVTNAGGQVRVSVDPAASDVIAASMRSSGTPIDVQTSAEFAAADMDGVYNVVTPGPLETSLVSHFLSRMLPLGHIKSTQSGDAQFLDAFKASPKWLRMADESSA